MMVSFIDDYSYKRYCVLSKQGNSTRWEKYVRKNAVLSKKFWVILILKY